MSETQPEKPADAWGQPISEERQAELQGYLDRWAAETEHGERKGPFDSVLLTGAEVSWLAEQSGRDELGSVPNLRLERAFLVTAHLEGADLRLAHLEGADLRLAHLEEAIFRNAHLEEAGLTEAHLEGADLFDAHLEGAFLSAYLETLYINSRGESV